MVGEISRPTAERLLVCVGTNPASTDLIRATKRMATSLKAEWFAVFVKTPRVVQLPEEEQNRRSESSACRAIRSADFHLVQP